MKFYFIICIAGFVLFSLIKFVSVQGCPPKKSMTNDTMHAHVDRLNISEIDMSLLRRFSRVNERSQMANDCKMRDITLMSNMKVEEILDDNEIEGLCTLRRRLMRILKIDGNSDVLNMLATPKIFSKFQYRCVDGPNDVGNNIGFSRIIVFSVLETVEPDTINEGRLKLLKLFYTTFNIMLQELIYMRNYAWLMFNLLLHDIAKDIVNTIKGTEYKKRTALNLLTIVEIGLVAMVEKEMNAALDKYEINQANFGLYEPFNANMWRERHCMDYISLFDAISKHR